MNLYHYHLFSAEVGNHQAELHRQAKTEQVLRRSKIVEFFAQPSARVLKKLRLEPAAPQAKCA
ncbi:MAG TPA: hypothetical protein VFS50_08310 [Meiothermus sp.]|jgi:hypothetical protein|nr:hypothetical protein [Meiothermus sp.]